MNLIYMSSFYVCAWIPFKNGKSGLITTLSQYQPEANRVRIDGQRVKCC